MPVIPSTQEVSVGRLQSEASWGKTEDYLKNNHSYKGGIAQAVEHLPSKHEVMFKPCDSLK
jgi:hypothetical protein